MTLWTCKACGLLVVPDGITPADIAKAMKEHKQACSKS